MQDLQTHRQPVEEQVMTFNMRQLVEEYVTKVTLGKFVLQARRHQKSRRNATENAWRCDRRRLKYMDITMKTHIFSTSYEEGPRRFIHMTRPRPQSKVSDLIVERQTR